jgi:plastocyanin
MRTLLCATLLFTVLACAEQAAEGRGRVVESSAGTVELGIREQGYTPGVVQSPAAVTGTISTAAAPADSMVAVARDPQVCGDSAAIREIALNGSALGNALVWVVGVPSGKKLPETRRTTLTIERCRIDPRVTAVVAGSTINLFSRDRAAHTVRFYREGNGTPVARIMTMDAGQVVPSEAIAEKPGIVEARCEMHPWVRGYVAVFEHPYFAITDASGGFTIDQLPAGTYTVKVWHEGMDKPAEQKVVVNAAGTGNVTMTVALR